MNRNCNDCKFYDIDYEWDDEIEDEVEIKSCRKGHGLFLHSPFKCPCFEKYEPKPYVEEFTKCDKCEYLEQCKNERNVIACTTCKDDFAHYICGFGAYCRKESEENEPTAAESDRA